MGTGMCAPARTLYMVPVTEIALAHVKSLQILICYYIPSTVCFFVFIQFVQLYRKLRAIDRDCRLKSLSLQLFFRITTRNWENPKKPSVPASIHRYSRYRAIQRAATASKKTKNFFDQAQRMKCMKQNTKLQHFSSRKIKKTK